MSNTIKFSDSELYILGCVLGSLRYNGNTAVHSLLGKIHEATEKFNIGCEDYDQVVFYVNDSGSARPEDKIGSEFFVTVDFEGEDTSLDSDYEEAILVETTPLVDPVGTLYAQLDQCAKEGYLEGVKIYSEAIQRLYSFN